MLVTIANESGDLSFWDSATGGNQLSPTGVDNVLESWTMPSSGNFSGQLWVENDTPATGGVDPFCAITMQVVPQVGAAIMAQANATTTTAGNVVIYVDQNTMPANFDLSAVTAAMRKVLTAAGVKARLLVTPTDNAKKSLGLGWTTYATKQVSYTQYVTFNNSGFPIAYTKGTTTELFPNNVASQIDPVGGSATTAYANVLLHEVYWFGVLGHWSDEFFSGPGALGYCQASSTKLLTITAADAKTIDGNLP